MKIHAIQCPSCKDIIYSRANHDFRRCGCDEIFIDGGQEFGGRWGFTKEKPIAVEIEVHGADLKALYDDWNRSPATGGGSLGRIERGCVDLRHQILSIDGVRFDGAPGSDSDVRQPDGDIKVPKSTKSRRSTKKKRSGSVDNSELPP